ncbi:hypothetical protein DL98DRAFT_146070 [Cadophora sp. DSE1049]|nr:hypothetical protein DL98DRAFT_146070 [Cadophora sp. DSE1049]
MVGTCAHYGCQSRLPRVRRIREWDDESTVQEWDGKMFTIHTAVVKTLSDPLAVMMNGSMREEIDGVASLREVDEQTFMRFCKYAYMGNYTPTQQHPVPASSNFDRVSHTYERLYGRNIGGF